MDCLQCFNLNSNSRAMAGTNSTQELSGFNMMDRLSIMIIFVFTFYVKCSIKFFGPDAAVVKTQHK